ncbi:recombinase family protein [Bradyrhizobium sp. ISRA464]|nr:recombinase family protein [Bradyrhizobium sp. ISRA463]WGS29456.1 recombinase family protein [Bradyrhizobium sp. ISRA464]
MSRDSQRYSTANQADVISAFARERNITIVRIYADEGLSGLAIHCRDGLKALRMMAALLKNNKRFNAADFSRQLSKKVFLGQSRVTRMGFWHGGMPGYGLRRQLLDETGIVRTSLNTARRNTSRLTALRSFTARTERSRPSDASSCPSCRKGNTLASSNPIWRAAG